MVFHLCTVPDIRASENRWKPDLFGGKAVADLLGEEVKAEYLNDDRLLLSFR
ncbi:MAG: hypothetical protein WBA93_10770 [Microcoleaceae cyanobacterium]